ncbi:MAG TPA: ATP-binding protein, partial [bacterium]|nr:ATP-binding protein [bacterium]
SIVTLSVLVVLAVAVVGSAAMVWLAYRRPARAAEASEVVRVAESTPLSAVLERIERRMSAIDPGLQLALRTRCEVAQRLPAAESLLALEELLFDLERLGASPSPGPAPAALPPFLARVVDGNPGERAGIVAHEILDRFRERLARAVGAEFAERMMSVGPALPRTEQEWAAWVADGRMKAWFEALLGASTGSIGRSPLLDLAERTAREVGAQVPLVSLPQLLSGFCEDCLVAEKTNASVRESLWNDFVGARRDLDAAKVRLADADLNKWASIGRLAAGVAHEINNPATFVLANASLTSDYVEKLRAYHAEVRALAATDGEIGRRLSAIASGSEIDRLDAELRDMARDSVDGILRIGAIVRDLQSFSRAAANFTPVETDLNALVESVINMARVEIRDRATVERRYGERVNASVDPLRISQVLTNLVVNAAQAVPATQRTPGHITVRTSGDESGAAIDVEDDGPGIPPDVLPHIFDPFFTTKPVGKGTGLGLAISREIVERHGGRLSVESEPGKGARFRVWLPRNAGASAPAGRPAGADAEESPARRVRERILVVDDEPRIRAAYERLLRSRFDVTGAEAGEGLALIEAGREFDVIFVDLAMPGMNGREFHAELKRHSPALASRVVLLFGGAAPGEMEEISREFPERCLVKPATAEQLREMISRVCAARPA